MAARYAARGRPDGRNPYGAPEEEITQQQEEAMQMIKDTDAEIDEALGAIELGMGDLKSMAEKANQEVTRQNAMIGNVTDNISNVQETVDDVNADLKETMGRAQRGCDKVCCDAFCICIMVGLIVALVKISAGL
jgi:t-SNARE complex subunit (syntaxin)